MTAAAAYSGTVLGDPEFRFLPDGVAVGRFRLRLAPVFNEALDRWCDLEPPDLVCTVRRELAEYTGDFVVQGSGVTVCGELHPDTARSPDGRTVEIMTLEVTAVDLDRDGGGGQPETQSEPDGAPPAVTVSTLPAAPVLIRPGSNPGGCGLVPQQSQHSFRVRLAPPRRGDRNAAAASPCGV